MCLNTLKIIYIIFKKMIKPIYIYIHVCCINNYKEVFSNLIHCIKNSGLYDSIKEIRCCVLGNYDKTIFENDPKIIIVKNSNDLSLYETYTINQLYKDAFLEDFNVLYMHTKGVTNPDNIFVKSWVNYLCYFNIYKYDICVKLLNENNFDTVGVNLAPDALLGHPIHYAGNFWWSNTTYLKRLIKLSPSDYCDPEFWLCRKKIGKYIGLWYSNCSHYGELYDENQYKNKDCIYSVLDYTTLDYISNKYHLDKNISSGWHNYIPGYTFLFENIRYNVRNMLEIGIGSTEHNHMWHVTGKGYKTGNSLKCWNEYFSHAKIYGLDIYEHKELNTDTITTFVADQSAVSDLQNVMKTINCKLDVIIDDGSHIGAHQVISFMYLHKYLSNSGIYVIENVQPPNIDGFIDLSIFPDYFRKYIIEEFTVKIFDTRQDYGRADDFLISFTRK
jgi:hypothetical protein